MSGGHGVEKGLSRRRFLGITAATGAGVGFTPLLQLLPPGAVHSALAGGATLRFFDEHQAAVVEEASARLIPGPTDDVDETSPGAREAGVVVFIDVMLSAFDDDPPRIFAGGPWSDRHGGTSNAMGDFVPLATWQEEQWRSRLAALGDVYRTGVAELDAAAGGDFAGVDAQRMDEILAADTPSGFRRVLFEHTIEGMYSVPEYGGNRDLVGWADIAYAGDVAPTGWDPSEVSGSDGPDPVPPDFELPFPATLPDEVTGAGEEVPTTEVPTTEVPTTGSATTESATGMSPTDVPDGSSAAGSEPLAALAAPTALAGLAEPEPFLRAALPGLTGRWVRPGTARRSSKPTGGDVR